MARHPVLTNAFALTVLALPVFHLNRMHLFHGLDGMYMRQLVRNQFEWMPLGVDFTMNPLQGMGNIFFPFNMNLTPALVLQTRLSGGQIYPAIAFTLFALELAAAAYLIGQVAGLPRAVRLAGAWLLPVLALPFIWPPIFNPVYALIPNCVDLLLVESLLLLAFVRLGDGPVGLNLLCAAAIVVVPGWAVLANPLIVATIIPTLAVAFIVIAAGGLDRRHLLWRLGALVALLAAMVAGGFVEFLRAATFYTVPAFFADELLRNQSGLGNASIVFQGLRAGQVMVALSVVGAIAAIRREPPPVRRIAWLHLLLSAAYMGGGYVVIEFLPGWRGPQMHYFEMSIWPFYVLFAVYCIYVACQRAMSAFPILNSQFANPPLRLSPTRLLAGAIALWIGYQLGASLLVRRPGLPAADAQQTSIVRHLAAELPLQPGGVFRGSVATFAGGDPTRPIHWGLQHALDFDLSQATGNDHRLVGLWALDIPTLVEYNHYVTPAMHLVFTRLFARPIDPQIRNIVALTTPDHAALRAFGTRFVISDKPLGAGYTLRDSLDWSTTGTLFLYELPRPNLGGYSPTRIVLASNAAGIIEALKRPVDYETEAVMDAAPATALAPAQSAELRFIKGGFRVIAESPSTSLLVLPVQFSHCLRLDSPAAGGAQAKLFRANLLQTGLLFSGRVDVQASFRFGPLGHARCRSEDIKDMNALGIAAAATRFPLVRQGVTP